MTQPGYQTTQDILSSQLSELLNTIAPGLGPMLSPLLLKKGLGLFGISSYDPMLQAILQTNMSVYGASRMQQDNILRSAMYGHFSPQILSGRSSALAKDSMETFFSGLARTTTSEGDWKKLDASQRLGSYDEYIAQKTAGYMANPLWTTAYKFVDPMGSVSAGQSLSQAAINIARPGLLRDNRDSLVVAQEIVDNLFRDANGKYNFDKADYGNMTQPEVAALTAAITKDFDLLEDFTGGNLADKLKTTTSKLRDKVKAYADALGPLKDIFGDDIPSMLKAAEELSGQSLTVMGPERARDIAISAVARTASGRYSMNKLGASAATIRTTLESMDGVSSMTSLGALEIGADILDAINTTKAPTSMTKQLFTEQASEMLIRAGASQASDMFDQAYALWADAKIQKDTDANISYEAFKSEYQASRAGGQDEIQALLSLSNQSNTVLLKQAASASARYRQARSDGLGAGMSIDAHVDRLRANFTNLATRGSLVDTLGLRDYTYNDRKTLIDRALTNFSTLQGMSEADRSDYLTSTYKDISDTDIAAISRVVNTIQNSDNFNALEIGLISQDSINKAEEAKKQHIARSTFVEAVTKSIASDGKELITRLLGLDTGKEFSLQAAKEYLGTGAEQLISGSESAVRETAAVTQASALLNNIDIKNMSKEQKQRIAEDVQYSATTGLSNKNYRVALNAFMQAEDKSAKQTAARLMSLYKDYGNVYVNDYLGLDENGTLDMGDKGIMDKVNALFGGPDQPVNSSGIKKRLLSSRINKYLKTHDGDNDDNALSDEFKELNKAFTGSEVLSDTAEITNDKLRKFVSDYRTKHKNDSEALESLDRYVAAINQATSGEISASTSVPDFLKSIVDSVTELVTKISNIDSKIPPTSGATST